MTDQEIEQFKPLVMERIHPRQKVVVVMSGGLDSTVLLYELVFQFGVANVKALSIDYGQRHSKEIVAAADICEMLGTEHQIADLRGIRHLINNSSQTDPSIPVPQGHYADETMKVTVVPNRNMILLAVAIGFAVNEQFNAVAFGAHAGDHTIYPDCRPEFASAMNTASLLANYQKVEILRPFINLSKADIVTLGDALGVPMGMTWSCYEGDDIHCGKCGTCVERREAFKLANVTDPTYYVED